MSSQILQINKKSILYDYTKVVITLIVVLGHVTRMYTGNSVLIPKYSSNVFVDITNIIYGFHMPLFMIISGAVYYLCIYDLDKYKNKMEFLKNKIKRLIVPYYFF